MVGNMERVCGLLVMVAPTTEHLGTTGHMGEDHTRTKNGDRYDGLFKNGRWDGKGNFEYASGDTYEGEMKNGRRHGRGTYTWADGAGSYSGSWYAGQKHGRGDAYIGTGIRMKVTLS